jgi:hypothetical protein
MLRCLDAGDIIAHHSDGIREFFLGHPFRLAQLSNLGPWFVGSSCSILTAAKITVRGLGLVEHSIPGYFIAVARRLCDPKEEPSRVDLDTHYFAAVINLQRRAGETVLFAAVERDDEATLTD